MPSQSHSLEDPFGDRGEGTKTTSSTSRALNHPSTTATTHNSHENPWESAANDSLWSSSSSPSSALETSTTALLNGDSNHHHDAQSSSPYASSSSCSFQCFQACLFLDLVAGTVLVLYVLLDLWGKKDDRATASFALAIGGVWLIRGVLAKVTKCGVAVSAWLSAMLSLVYLLLALSLAIYAVAKSNVCPIVIPVWNRWLSGGGGAGALSTLQVSVAVLGLAALEAIRYVWIQHWRHQEARNIREWGDDLNQSELVGNGNHTSSSSSRATGGGRASSSQPWWWRSNTTTTSNGRRRQQSSSSALLASPLLGDGSGSGRRRPHWSHNSSSPGYYRMDSGIGSPEHHHTTGNNSNDNDNDNGGSSSWWPFGAGRRRRTHSQDVRDDGSVDYASLNEDWASRSEEDPFWWTQEGGGGGGGGGATTPSRF